MAITIQNLIKVVPPPATNFNKVVVKRVSATSDAVSYTSVFDASAAANTVDRYPVLEVILPFIAGRDMLKFEVPATAPVPALPQYIYTVYPGRGLIPSFYVKGVNGVGRSTDQVLFVALRQGGTDKIKIQPQAIRGTSDFGKILQSPEYASLYAAGDVWIFSVPLCLTLSNQYLTGSPVKSGESFVYSIFNEVRITPET